MKKKKSFEIWQIKILSKSNKRRRNLVEEIRYLVKPNIFFEMLNLEDVSINIGISSLKGYKYRYLYLFRELMPILIDMSIKLSISKNQFRKKCFHSSFFQNRIKHLLFEVQSFDIWRYAFSFYSSHKSTSTVVRDSLLGTSTGKIFS